MSHLLILAAAVLAPAALALWSHRIEVGPRRGGAPPSLFAFAQRAQWAGVLAFLLWIPAVLGFRAPRFGSLIGELGDLLVRTPWAGAAIVGPPLLVVALTGLLAHDIARRARLTDWTWSAAWSDAFTLVGGGVSAFTLLFSGIGGLGTGQTRAGILAILCAIVVAAAAGGLRRRASGLTPQAITRGPLRDHVFALAERAGVTLTQLYVVPFRRFRLANAFAVQGRVVWLTDDLLRHLGRDEVDAVLMHELAHLARNDPARITRALFGVGLLTGVALAAGGWAVLVLALPLGLLGHLAYLRRIEHATDARALALGARPEALVTGLARLGALSQIPPRWSAAREWWLTHPSLERRARRIAAAADADPVRLVQLACDPPPAAGPWGVPDETAAPRAFNSEFRRAALGRLGWALVLVSVLAPAAVVAADQWLGFALPRPVVLALAVGAAFAGWLFLLATLGHGPMRALRRTLETRLRADAGDGADSGAPAFFVGLAPGAAPRLFEGFAAWDAGALVLAPGRLAYAGELTRFSIAPGEVREVRVDTRLPGWIRVPTIRIDWARADGSAGTFGFVPIGAAHPFAIRAEARRLRDAIDAWRSGGADAGSAPSLGAPPLERVTGSSPREIVRPAAIVLTWVLQIALACAASLVLGLSAGFGAPGTLDVVLAALATQVLAMLPFLVYREAAETPAAEDGVCAAA